MAIRKVELYPSAVLREKARTVEAVTPEIESLMADMVETMHHAGGAGLAANQVGVPLRVMVVNLGIDGGEEELKFFINPEILHAEGESIREEGCLSFPQLFEKVRRPGKVKVRALDAEGKPFELEGDAYLAHALCHEIDHLEGVLFLDRVSPVRREILKRKIRKLIREGEWDDPYPAG
jgi:peptide deformylase